MNDRRQCKMYSTAPVRRVFFDERTGVTAVVHMDERVPCLTPARDSGYCWRHDPAVEKPGARHARFERLAALSLPRLVEQGE